VVTWLSGKRTRYNSHFVFMRTDIPRVIASVEARMTSSRLPGKMLMDVGGKPVIIHVLDRLKRANTLDDIILATTTNPTDDVLASLAHDLGYRVFRGSEDDVLQRVVDAHNEMNSQVVVEICGDCPLIDASIVDRAVQTYLDNSCDVVAVGNRQSYPQGTEVQVFLFSAILDIAKRIDDPAVREHVSLYFYENQEEYEIIHLEAPDELRAPDIRLQLDYEEDLYLIREIYNVLEPKYGEYFGVHEIVDLLATKPELMEINSHCEERLPR